MLRPTAAPTPAPAPAPNTIEARYAATARVYERWWAPVLRPKAVELLGLVERRPARVLDLGTGTGTLALAAARRWRDAEVTALDGSDAMLAVAASRIARSAPSIRSRITLAHGKADALPFDDGHFDLVVSSFVLQLVPDRAAALREINRVLRPGGRLAFVTWHVEKDAPFAPREAFRRTVDELGFTGSLEPEEPRAGDLPSASAAESELLAAGFDAISAHLDLLVHAHPRATYLRGLEQYGERLRFESLTPAQRRTLRTRAAEALAALPDDAFTWRAPIVYALARRPR